jgi:hypothetical protein
MSNLLESARGIAHTLLSLKSNPITDENIAEVVKKVIAMNIKDGESFDNRELFEILQADYSISKGEITVMSDDIVPWLSNEKANINFELWNRYKLYMKNKDKSFPVDELDDFTDKILDKCINPKTIGSWDRRGMVVGHVQSGKTSNYVGLINKATDAGYKVIIVIAGTIGSLRRQTQERIDAGFIGRSSSAFIRENENKRIGVGNYPAKTDIYSLTSSYYKKNDEGDFNQAVANRLNIPIGNNPVVFVIKKNKSILENLIDWLSKNEKTKLVDGFPKLFDVPALIIDDEADAASVNATRNINDIKTINKLIRTLLNLFNQNTFIGYTATPYANLFISQDYNQELTTTVKNKDYKIGEDLFPRDFIINIKAPSNYIGAAKIFGFNSPNGNSHEPLDVFRAIDDFDPPFFRTINRNNKEDLPEYIPESLKVAIKSFILTCAIRRLRGQEIKHNSMLIHVALLVKWIDRVALLVNNTIRIYENNILSNDEGFLSELNELFENDFNPTTENILENIDYKDIRIEKHSWEDVKNELKKAVTKIEVRSVHGKKTISDLEYHGIEEIDFDRYPDGLSVIAVGGTRLSRGITLEGLSISYYLRTTKMYDSLMQMGRWFGYRPGYVDLCRLYTTETVFEWFNHITFATEEMRNDFDEMTAALQKPKDFTLKVRNHHGLLAITSATKLNFAQNLEISFSGTNPQTYQLTKTKSVIENNFKALNQLINCIGFPDISNIDTTRGKIRYLKYPNCKIDPIGEFLDSFKTDQPSIKNATLGEYIQKQNEKKNIKEWTICIVSNTDERVYINRHKSDEDGRKPKDDVISYKLEYNNESKILGCSVRNHPKSRLGNDYYLISKNQIDDLKDRQVDLTIRDLEKNEEIKDRRSLEQKGLLLIYALDPRGALIYDSETPIIGYSLHFPKIENEEKVSYTATINAGFDEEPQEDDDNPEDDFKQ